MHLLGHLMVWILILQHVSTLRVLLQRRREQPSSVESNVDNEQALRKVLKTLVNTKAYLTGDRRTQAVTSQDLANARSVVKGLSDKMSPRQLNQFLSQTMKGVNRKPLRIGEAAYDVMVEKELRHTMHKKNVALLDKPHVELAGRHDYLVINSGIHDPFVTVIPNNIYYDIEKKCANWLDDCSLQGIRSKLLDKVRSPFR